MVINIDLNDMFDMDDEDKLNEQFDDFMSNIDDLEEAKDVLEQIEVYENEAYDLWEKIHHLKFKARKRVSALKLFDVDSYVGKCFRFTIGCEKYSRVKYFKIMSMRVDLDKTIVARCFTLDGLLDEVGIGMRDMRLWEYDINSTSMIIDLVEEIDNDTFDRRLEHWNNKFLNTTEDINITN